MEYFDFNLFFHDMYWLVAFVVSIFYSVFGEKMALRAEPYKGLDLSKKIRKHFIHFLGSLVGFGLMYFLIRKAMFSIDEGQYTENIADVLLLIIALLGMLGYLPDVSYSIKKKTADLLEKIIPAAQEQK